MTFRETLQVLGEDLRRHWSADEGAARKARIALGTQGVWATAVFRFGQWVHGGDAGLATLPGKLVYKVLAKAVEVTTGISVPASCRIGPGFYIGHFGTIIVHPDTVMGARCSIGQGVTLGTRGLGDAGVPTLGDDVYLGAGAKVLGGVHVGDGAAVGANAVVVKDVPPGHVAVGIPARVRPRKG